MKRFFAIIITMILLLSCSVSHATYFPSVSMIQHYLEKYSPSSMAASGPHIVEIEGTVTDIYWCGDSNHYNMVLEMVDTKALTPVGKDKAQIIVHFQLHVDPIPFQIGDEISVYGTLNELYSSVMVPWVLAKFINGSDDF